ncbi:MAG TPA: hypothetical protein VNV66_16000 [Pilimelia sp.]|nr:hypothetical protein [Pilimelia sp.]
MRRILTVTLLALSLFGSMLPTSASAASTLTADVTSVTVVARGAAVDINTTVVCPAGMSGHLELNITQRSGGGLARGVNDAFVACTGEPQTVTMQLLASIGGEFFRPGDAIVTAYLYTCGDGSGCQWTRVDETVRITKN